MKRLFVLLIFVVATACSQQKSADLSTQIDTLIEQDKYEEALTELEGKEQTPEVLTLKETVHLNYGMFLVYRGETAMRERMNGALFQFIEVLKINKDNEKAMSEIEQILGVYSTFPDRSPDPEALEALKELGFNI